MRIVISLFLLSEHEEKNDDQETTTEDETCEFCDLCGMELEHHPDYQPCPPEEGFKQEFDSCPVCSKKEPTKEHVARHFLNELLEIVGAFEDPLACNKCDYQSEKNSISVALHLALNHDVLKNILLRFKSPQEPFENAMKKVALIGDTCPVCDFKDPSREHVSRHFMNELLNHIGQSTDHKKCQQCPFQGERPQNLAIHIALCHDMLDDFLSDHELVKKKRAEAMVKPKKISIGSTCPSSCSICLSL